MKQKSNLNDESTTFWNLEAKFKPDSKFKDQKCKILNPIDQIEIRLKS